MLGGGGSVTIAQCMSICMGHSGGIGISCVIVHSRRPSDCVLLQATPAGLVASPAVTGKRIQSLEHSCTEQTCCVY